MTNATSTRKMRGMPVSGTRWLDVEQQRAWRGYVLGSTLLMEQLDQDLRREFKLSMPEYEILVRLSEAPDHRMRMAQLADSVCHSRSRVTHTVKRLEAEDLVVRELCADDGRGVEALLTDKGMSLLEEAAHLHVAGVRDNLVDLVSPEDFAALGRVMNAVTDRLIASHPSAEMR
jgi:DNA-binding MarR family transcriptional regulator